MRSRTKPRCHGGTYYAWDEADRVGLGVLQRRGASAGSCSTTLRQAKCFTFGVFDPKLHPGYAQIHRSICKTTLRRRPERIHPGSEPHPAQPLPVPHYCEDVACGFCVGCRNNKQLHDTAKAGAPSRKHVEFPVWELQPIEDPLSSVPTKLLRTSEADSEPNFRGAGCGNTARTVLWEPGGSNLRDHPATPITVGAKHTSGFHVDGRVISCGGSALRPTPRT